MNRQSAPVETIPAQLSEASQLAHRAVGAARDSRPAQGDSADGIQDSPLITVLQLSNRPEALEVETLAAALEDLAARLRDAGRPAPGTKATQDAMTLIRDAIELATHGAAGLAASAQTGHRSVLSQINGPGDASDG